MKYSSHKEINNVILNKIKEGWRVTRGRGHIQLFHPKSGIVTISVSPSCPFAYKNVLADIKRLERSHI